MYIYIYIHTYILLLSSKSKQTPKIVTNQLNRFRKRCYFTFFCFTAKSGEKKYIKYFFRKYGTSSSFQLAQTWF